MALTVHHAPSSTVPGWVVAGKDQRCFPAGNSGYGRVSQFCISPLLKKFFYFFNSIYCVYYSFLNYFLCFDFHISGCITHSNPLVERYRQHKTRSVIIIINVVWFHNMCDECYAALFYYYYFIIAPQRRRWCDDDELLYLFILLLLLLFIFLLLVTYKPQCHGDGLRVSRSAPPRSTRVGGGASDLRSTENPITQSRRTQ